MASAWKLGDVTWDRHYHVTLLSDTRLRALLDEIGLEKEMKWVETKTGFFSGGKINPLIGACGVSAFPMSARLCAKMALETDYDNFILMHALGSNTGGQLASVVAGSVLLVLVTSMLGI